MNIKKLLMTIFRICISIPYCLLKLLPSKNKVVMISRQQNDIPEDFALLCRELEKRNIKTVILCRQMGGGIISLIRYCFHILRCEYHLATSRACVVDTYCIPVSMLKHKKQLFIVQIWHAMGAVKKFGYQSLDTFEGRDSSIADGMHMHRNYSAVTCTAEATRPFYAEAFNTDISKILPLGMPRIDSLLADNTALREKIFSDYPYLKEKPVILYAPTFRKGKNPQYEKLIDCIDTDKYNVLVKLHPLCTEYLPDKYTSCHYSTSELLCVADYVISDYSAVVFEAALLNLPLYFFVYDIDEYTGNRGLNINPTAVMPSCTAKTAEDIAAMIERGSYDFEALKKFKETYVETADAHNCKRICDFICDNAKL